MPSRCRIQAKAIVGFLAVALLAGCTANSSPGATPEEKPEAPASETFAAPAAEDGQLAEPPVAGPAPDLVWNNLTACTEVVAFRAIDFSHANALLPLGYEAGDAGRFLRLGGQSLDMGKALVILGVFQCEGFQLGPGPMGWAGLVVYLKTPHVDGLDLDPAYDDLYLLNFHTDQAAAVEALAAIGAPAAASSISREITLAASAPAQGGTATASAADADGPVFALEMAGGPRSEREIVVRFWHERDEGIALLEFKRDPTAWLGSAMTSCSLRPGSIEERAFGDASCGEDAVGAIWPDPSGFESTYRLVVGAHVGT